MREMNTNFRLRKFFFVAVLAGAMGSLLSSCYPEEVNSYSELDLVFTNYDETYDFNGVMTYHLPDTVIPILDEDDDPEDVNTTNDAFILQEIRKQLGEAGLTYVADTSADFDVVFIATKMKTTTLVYWYDYWYGYWGWYPGYYPGWGWGYPSVSSYTTGTLHISMYDPDNFDEDSEIVPVEWNGLANGLLNVTGTQTTRNRISIALEKMFNEFPNE